MPKIDEKFQNGQTSSTSWEVKENSDHKKTNNVSINCGFFFSKSVQCIDAMEGRCVTLEESREVIPMMEAVVEPDEDSRILWQRWYRNCRRRDRQLLSFQEQNQSLKSLNSGVLRAAESFCRIQKNCSHRSSNRKPESNSWKTRISNGRN